MNPYEVLGLSRDASDAQIRKAYRDLCLKHHPDRNPDDPKAEDRFKEVSASYQILIDPSQRRAYELGGSDFTAENINETVQGFIKLFREFAESSPLFEDIRDEVMSNAAPPPTRKKKAKKKVKKKAKAKKKPRRRQPTKPQCEDCGDVGYRVLVQGPAKLKVPCRRCVSPTP